MREYCVDIVFFFLLFLTAILNAFACDKQGGNV